MAKLKSFYYLVDRLTAAKVPTLKRALLTISGVEESIIGVDEGLIELIATRVDEEKLRIACSIADVNFRTRIKKHKPRSS